MIETGDLVKFNIGFIHTQLWFDTVVPIKFHNEVLRVQTVIDHMVQVETLDGQLVRPNNVGIALLDYDFRYASACEVASYKLLVK